MAWTEPATAIAGSVLTAAWLNTYLRDNMTELRAGAFAVSGQVGGSMLTALSATQMGVIDGPATAGNFRDGLLVRAELKDYSETIVDVAIVAGALTINLESGNVFRVTLNANVTTLTIQNPPATGRLGSITVIFEADGTPRTVAWPAPVEFADGAAPTMSSVGGKRDVVVLMTVDGGTTWLAVAVGQNF